MKEVEGWVAVDRRTDEISPLTYMLDFFKTENEVYEHYNPRYWDAVRVRIVPVTQEVKP